MSLDTVVLPIILCNSQCSCGLHGKYISNQLAFCSEGQLVLWSTIVVDKIQNSHCKLLQLLVWKYNKQYS